MSQPGPSTGEPTRRAASARNASPPNPPSELEDEVDIEEVVRIQPPPGDLDLQDFKSIKIDRLIVLEDFKNYERWAQQLNMIFKVLDARDVVINGYQPPQGASAVALRTYKHIERNSQLLLLHVISEPITAQIARHIIGILHYPWSTRCMPSIHSTDFSIPPNQSPNTLMNSRLDLLECSACHSAHT